MPDFAYRKAADIAEAVSLLETAKNVMLMAGGTDLLVGLRGGKYRAETVLDIKGIPELKELKEDSGGITIGAAVTLNEICLCQPVLNQAPVLAEGCHSVGSYSIRNRATLGGNICNASPAADTAAPLYSLGARVIIQGQEGKRAVAIEDFFTGPGQTALKKGELVIAVLIPTPYPRGKGVYHKFSRTASVDLSTVGVAVQSWGGDRVRIAVSAVAPTPLRATAVEDAVNNGERDFYRAARLVREDISPITDLRGSRDYRYHLAEVLVRRGLAETMGV